MGSVASSFFFSLSHLYWRLLPAPEKEKEKEKGILKKRKACRTETLVTTEVTA